MLFKTLFTIVTAATGVLADCNPLKQSGCPADPALGTSIKETFQSKSKYFDEVKPNGLSYGSNGLDFKLAKRFDNPSIKSNFYLMFGKVEVVLQAAEGKGIISSFYLQSDDLDEVDIELVGGDPTQWQSNFFSKGDTTTYDRGQFHDTSINPLQNFLTYTIEWTEEKLTWAVNGNVVRTLTPDNPEGYPQSPMYIMAGIWAGGDPSNAPGTIEWAGGETDYSQAPFNMYIKSIVASDYSSGKSYSYGDQSGSYKSIKSDGGEINGRASEGASEFETLATGGSIKESATPSSSSVSGSSSSVPSSTVSSLSANPSSSASSSASVTSSSSATSSKPASTTESSSSASSSETSESSTTTSSASSSASSSVAPEVSSTTATPAKTTAAPSTTEVVTPSTTSIASSTASSTLVTLAVSSSSSTASSFIATVTSGNGASFNSAFLSVAFALYGYILIL